MKILMVCLGNICRSPLAEGILQDKIAKRGLGVEVDSAGTAAYHVGEPPDPRSQEIAAKYGIDISYQRARRFEIADFDHFDKIYAMDNNNYSDIISRARHTDDEKKVEMIMETAHPGEEIDVPDPYYGGNNGFEKVYKMLDASCELIADMIADK
jgi:protein-tyrosine phosphatase